MPTCKECIHYEPCKDSYYNAEQLSRFPLGFLEKENAEKNCAFFKDRSKFVELPCKVGEKVYGTLFTDITENTISEIKITNEGLKVVLSKNRLEFPIDFFNREFFLTREEAEQALKECIR